MTTRLGNLLVTLCLLRSIASAQPSTGQPADAEQLYLQGQAEYDAKHFDSALVLWIRSYELSKEPGLLFNIGQAYRQRGKPGDCATARDAYQKFLELDVTSDQRAVAEGFVVEMQKCAANATSAVNAKVTAPPIAFPPNAEPKRDTLANPGRTKRIASVAIIGGGVALVATGLYFGRRASSLNNEVANGCASGCDWGDFRVKDADGRSAERRQYVFYGIGAAAVVTGGVLYWLGMRERAPSTTVGVTRRADGAAITWGGTW